MGGDYGYGEFEDGECERARVMGLPATEKRRWMHQKLVWIKMNSMGTKVIIVTAPEVDCLALNKAVFCWFSSCATHSVVLGA